MAVRFEPGGNSRPVSRTRFQGSPPAPLNRGQRADAARYAGLANQYANRANNAWAGRYAGQAAALSRQAQSMTPGWNEPMNPAMRAAGAYVRGVYAGTQPIVGSPQFGKPKPYQLSRQQSGMPNPYNAPKVTRPAVTRPNYGVDTWNSDDLVDWIDYSTQDWERAANWANSTSNPNSPNYPGNRGGGGGGYGGGYGGGGGGGGGYNNVPQWYMNLGMWRI